MGYDLYSLEVDKETGEPESFEFNNWSMARLRDVLRDLDVLDEEFPYPDWPEEPGEDHFDDDGNPLTDEAEAYLQELDDVRAMHAGNGKVPSYKFSSNDGWIVTPEECEILSRAILGAGKEKIKAILAKYVGEDAKEHLDEVADRIVVFGRFCKWCSSLGGFSVY